MKKLIVTLMLTVLLTGCASGFKNSNKTLNVANNQEEIMKIISGDLNVPSDEFEDFKIRKNPGHHKGRTRASFKHDGKIYDYEINSDVSVGHCKKYSLNAYDTISEADSISEDEALNIALTHAGISKEEARFLRVKLDRSYTHSEYEIEFTSGMYEYDYEIAMDGSILSFEKEIN